MLRVHLLGGLRVEGVADAQLGSRKGRRLLAALAVAAPSAVSVDALVELLWPDGAPSRPTEQVGVLVSRLRRTLGSDRIVRHDAGYSLTCDWCDLEELAARSREAAEALDSGRSTAARAAAAAALSLGDPAVLPEEEGDWVEGARARALADVATARRVAVESAVVAGDLQTAIVHAEAHLGDDPLDEPVTRSLMLAHVRSGRPAAALAAYARLRAHLAEQLGVSPSDEVEALHTAILTGAVGEGEAPAGSTAVLAGRDTELAALDGHLGRSSRSHVVLVEGEPGIGKTSLLDAWVARLPPGQVLVLRGRGDPLGRDLPLQPLADALHDAVRVRPEVLESLPIDDRTQLAASLGVGDPVLPATDTVTVSQPVGTARLYAAIDHLVAALAEGRQVVVVLDDLHHAGSPTWSWVSHAVRRSEDLLVVAARHVGTAPVPGASTIRLGPLDRDAVATIVGETRATELLERSGGHPLLLSALADAAPGEAPTDLRDAVARQVAVLGDAATTVRRAAVLGPTIDLDLLAGVEARPATAILADLEAGVGAGLLVDSATGLRFRHDLVRQTLESQVSPSRRRLVHREAARRLATRPRVDWAAVGVHAREGGDDTLAADAYRRAAVTASSRFDPAAAEAYLDDAVALDPSAAVLVQRARVRMARQDLDGAAADAAAAVAADGGAPALETAAWVAYYRRHYDDARTWADEARSLADDDGVLLGAVSVGSRIRHGAGDLAGALALLDGRGEGPPRVRGVADVWHAHALVHAGDPATALRLADRALSVGDGLAQPFAPLHGRFARTMALGQLGRARDALAACDELDAAVVRFGEQAARFEGPVANIRGWVLRNLGRHDEARESNLRALDAAGDDAGPRTASMAEAYWVALLDLADGALLTGCVDEAADLLDRCAPIETWDGTMAWHQRHRLGVQQARLALATGRPAAAADLARRVAGDAAARGAHRYRVLAGAVLAAADAGAPLSPIEELDRVAGLESWRYLAAVALTRDDDALRRRAEQRVAALAAAAGEVGDALGPFADAVIRPPR